MALPLLRRIDLDSKAKTKDFLANAEPQSHFAATRDRTTLVGSLHTFKHVGSEWDPTPTSRGMLRPYLVNVFGKVESVRSTNKSCIVTLRCPENVTCNAQRMFERQFIALKGALKEDSEYLDGTISSTWFCETEGEYSAAIPEMSFVVHVPTRIISGSHILVQGNQIEMIVGMKRTEKYNVKKSMADHRYKITASDLWPLNENGLALKDDIYTCDITPYFGCSRCAT